MKVYVLCQYDQWQTRTSRIIFGIFSRESKAKQACERLNLNADRNSVTTIETVTVDCIDEF